MRTFLSLVFLLLVSISSFAQAHLDQQALRETYLRKSKSKKTTGWILVGTGVAMIGGGFIWVEDKTKTHDLIGLAGLAAAGAGLGLTITGAFFLGVSEKYNRKAAAISIRIEQATQPRLHSFVQTAYPALALQIYL